MKAPLSWLQDFVDINVDIETLTHTMIMHGWALKASNVVTARMTAL